MKEIWKTTTVNKDYEVSNLGNVRSNKHGKVRLLKPFRRGHIRTDADIKGVYLAVRLLSDGTEKDYAVHRLVAMEFIDNPHNLPQVNHINGIRNDNRVENLEWCDNSYNIWHSYNILGNTNGTEKIVCQYTKDGMLCKEWKSISEAEAELGIDGSSISEVCRKDTYRKLAGGYIWRYKGDDDVELVYTRTSPVIQISKYGEKLKRFDSVRDASIEIGVSEGGVSGCCLKRPRGYNYAGGYLWRYEDDYDENEFGYYLDKTFVKMTRHNLFVAEYKGTHDLVDNSGCDLIKVIMCCNGKRQSTNGFKWCIKEEGDKTRTSRREKPVVQFDANMNYMAEYNSAVEAATANGLHATHISDCCICGTHRTTGGYKWMFKEDYLNKLHVI